MAGKYRNSWYKTCKYGFSILPNFLFHNILSFIMHKRFGVKFHWLHIKEPVTFSEKLQYLKSHPAVPNEVELADKYLVRNFIRKTIGEKYLVTLEGKGVYSTAEDVDFKELPNAFVIKLTKGSGYNLICNDKSKLDITKTKRMLNNWLKVNCYYFSRERQYKGKARLICETMLEYNITDYKFFCFDGEPKFVELYIDRLGSHKKVFYDMNWEKAGFTTANDVCDIKIEQPKEFQEMYDVAKKLSQGISFVRVDLYVHGGAVYFGEMTFHPAGGYTPITPHEWDIKLGKMIKLD